MPELPDLDPTASIVLKEPFNETQRAVVGISLGPHVDLAALPHPDTKSPDNAVTAGMKRMAIKPLIKNRRQMRKLRKFVKSYLETQYQPISPGADLSFETWLKNRPYPDWRKAELQQIYDDLALMSLERRDKLVKCFIKDETYSEFKFARGIYARSDVFKVLFGPLVAAIEEQVYAHPGFIKKIPVDERPQYIRDHLSDLTSLKGATDITSMEASFDPELMAALDVQLFEYFFSKRQSDFERKLYMTPTGLNECVFRWFTMFIRARRMSGEMCTSLCNGFANAATIEFLCDDLKLGIPRYVVEGDDALFVTPSGRLPRSNDYLEIGFRVKLQTHTSYATASFCGLIFDEEDLINVTDPLKVLSEFAWANSKYAGVRRSKKMALLRCKALSYLHQYYGCPIIQELALYGLRMTKSYNISTLIEKDRSMTQWQREKYRQALTASKNLITGRDVPANTRLLIERQFGISIEVQVQIEQLLRSKNDLEPIQLHQLLDFPTQWVDYSLRFVVPRMTPIVYQESMDMQTIRAKLTQLKPKAPV
jgi:hypothetical protein